MNSKGRKTMRLSSFQPTFPGQSKINQRNRPYRTFFQFWGQDKKKWEKSCSTKSHGKKRSKVESVCVRGRACVYAREHVHTCMQVHLHVCARTNSLCRKNNNNNNRNNNNRYNKITTVITTTTKTNVAQPP